MIAYETGNPDSIGRLAAHFGGEVTWDQIKTIAPQQLARMGVPEDQAREIDLPKARMLIARVSGYDGWVELEESLSGRSR